MPSRKTSATAREINKYFFSLAHTSSAYRRVWGDLGRKRGDGNEERLMYLVLQDLAKKEAGDSHILPDWITGYEDASQKDDERKKTDAFVVTSDVGKIRVQIKSSQKGYDNARLKDHQRNHIAMLIVDSTMPDHVVLYTLSNRVGEIRKRYIEERTKFT